MLGLGWRAFCVSVQIYFVHKFHRLVGTCSFSRALSGVVALFVSGTFALLRFGSSIKLFLFFPHQEALRDHCAGKAFAEAFPSKCFCFHRFLFATIFVVIWMFSVSAHLVARNRLMAIPGVITPAAEQFVAVIERLQVSW